jgi:hypothetical protein
MSWSRLVGSGRLMVPAIDAVEADGRGRRLDAGWQGSGALRDPRRHMGYDATLVRASRAMRRGDWDEAEALLMAAGAIAGWDAAYFNLVGVLREARGDYRAARQLYGNAIRADRHYQPAQQNMRRLYELWTFGHSRQAVALADETP